MMAPTRRGRPPAALRLDLRPGTSSPTPSALPPERPHIQRSPTRAAHAQRSPTRAAPHPAQPHAQRTSPRAAPHPAPPHPCGPTSSAAPPGRPHKRDRASRKAAWGPYAVLHISTQHPPAPHPDAIGPCPIPRRSTPLPHTSTQHPAAPHLDAMGPCPIPRRSDVCAGVRWAGPTRGLALGPNALVREMSGMSCGNSNNARHRPRAPGSAALAEL